MDHLDDRSPAVPPGALTVAPGAGAPPDYPARPPVSQVLVGSMVLVIVGGIYLAAHLPQRAPLGPAYGLLAAGAALLVAGVVLVARLRAFAWGRFFQVLRWALLAYVVIAGMLEYVFVLDGTNGPLLAILTSMLVMFAVDVPVVLAFSVARYELGGIDGLHPPGAA
ncbi:MAG: hypothetical protein ACRDYZ_13160 [Acidimicrobiales bacterium]